MNQIQSTESSISQNKQENLDHFKSLYYLVKGKRDSDIKFYNDNKKITRSDIIHLNQKVVNKLRNHNVQTSITTLAINLSNLINSSAFKKS